MENKIDLPLADVENLNDKIIFNFIDEEKGEIYDITWNKQKYDQTKNAYVPDKGKELQVNEWCEKQFGLPLEQIQDAEGQVHTVYICDGFNSLWKVANKFTKEMVGELYNVIITDIDVKDTGIEIFFELDGELYSVNMRYTKWYNGRLLVNPQKRRKTEKNFEEMFGFPVTEAEKAIGKEIVVEGASAFNSRYYGTLKKVK